MENIYHFIIFRAGLTFVSNSNVLPPLFVWIEYTKRKGLYPAVISTYVRHDTSIREHLHIYITKHIWMHVPCSCIRIKIHQHASTIVDDVQPPSRFSWCMKWSEWKCISRQNHEKEYHYITYVKCYQFQFIHYSGMPSQAYTRSKYTMYAVRPLQMQERMLKYIAYDY